MHPEKFTQHNPYTADGVKGFREFVNNLPSENNPLQVMRAFQDGAYVFIQAEGSISGQNIFFDIFRFEDGLIVEQWVFSAKAAPPNDSGHTLTDGPTQAKHLEDTEKNKSLIRDYYQTVHISGDHSKIPQYVAANQVRHEPGVRDGLASFLRDLAEITKSRTIDEITFVFGQGDFVFVAAKGTHEGDACVYIDLYRVENQQIVEHWGFSENIPPQSAWKNNNGML
jgi:predicted SnoaL-like aldol condensation-catalyzing enzyme